MADQDLCEGLNPVVFHTPGPNFDSFEEENAMDHGGYWASQGKTVVMGGPFKKGAMGMMILAKGTTYARAQELAAADPAIVEGFLLADVKCWNPRIQNR